MIGFPRQSKFFRIEPSLPKLRPNFSKKSAWLSFGFRFLPGIEPFQAVIATPRAKRPFFAPFSAIRLPRGQASFGERIKLSHFLIFASKISAISPSWAICPARSGCRTPTGR
jgi:hypothetical protein